MFRYVYCYIAFKLALLLYWYEERQREKHLWLWMRGTGAVSVNGCYHTNTRLAGEEVHLTSLVDVSLIILAIILSNVSPGAGGLTASLLTLT